jgi:hypothetical protein
LVDSGVRIREVLRMRTGRSKKKVRRAQKALTSINRPRFREEVSMGYT